MNSLSESGDISHINHRLPTTPASDSVYYVLPLAEQRGEDTHTYYRAGAGFIASRGPAELRTLCPRPIVCQAATKEPPNTP